MSGRKITATFPVTKKGPINRIVGSLDIDSNGTFHPLEAADPFFLLDAATITKHNTPPFGKHPHFGHSVVSVLLKGKIRSWDSATQKVTVVEGPSSYWVNAGSGIFHEEASVIEDESDTNQHPELFQIGMLVKEEDRQKPPSLQHSTDIPVGDLVDEDGKVVGSIQYFVGGINTAIKTPHPILIGHVSQEPGTTAKIPIDGSYAGLVVHIKGSATYGNNKDVTTNEFEANLFDSATGESENYLQSTTLPDSSVPCRYLICAGERIEEPWFKKLAANGIIIAKDEEEARAIGSSVEKDGSFVLE